MIALTSEKLRHWLHRFACWSVIVSIAIFAIVAGLVLRRYAWDQTEPARYTVDINNAFRQGTQAIQVGYLDRYDEEGARPSPQYMGLDYAPGRLAIAMLWTGHVRKTVDHWDGNRDHLTIWHQQFYDRARTLHRQYELVRPMLMINITGELLSMLAMFLLVRRYTTGRSPNHRPMRGAILGLIAALFFWLDPALISNAHCWPQWDSWVLPFFLWAVLLGSWDFWFCSGAIIAAGAMFKGQILFGAPLLILWPLFQGRWGAVVRWIVGLLAASAVITAVWLVRVPGELVRDTFAPGHVNSLAIRWLILCALIFSGLVVLLWNPVTRAHRLGWALITILIVQVLIFFHLPFVAAVGLWFLLTLGVIVAKRRKTWRAAYLQILAIVLIVTIVLLYPMHPLAPTHLSEIIGSILGMALLLRLTPRTVVPFAAAGWAALALFACIPLFNASHGWFDVGIAYGTHHYEKMASGENNNLAALLQEKWGWDDLMAPLITLPPGNLANTFGSTLAAMDPGVEYHTGDTVSLPLKYFLVGIWISAVILSSIGAAMNDHSRNPRFLAALCAPWIGFFAVMAQMHQRYLLWGASLSSASAVLSPGYAVLHLFLSFVSWTQELKGMADNRYVPGNYSDALLHSWLIRFVNNWHPGIGWAVLLTAGIYVYTAVKWTSRE